MVAFTKRPYWEKQAGTYPRPFGKTARILTDRVIGILEQRKLLITGAHILDVGSGTGIFALPFAQKGATVTALDISASMLKILAMEAERHGLSVTDTIRTSWKEIVPEERLDKTFDMVFASMSNAVETEADLSKMEKCSSKWCVVVATGEIKRPPFIEKAMRRFELPLGPRPDVRRIRAILSRMGRNFSYDVFPIFVREKKTISQMVEDATRRFESYGRKPSRDKIQAVFSSILHDITPNRAVACSRRSDIGVLIWRADEE